MYCEKCGAALDDSAAFCEKCGAQIQGANTRVNQPNIIPADEQQNVYILYTGQQAVAYYKVLIIKIIAIVISLIIIYIIVFGLIDNFDGLIEKAEYSYGYGSFSLRVENEAVEILKFLKNLFVVFMVIITVCDILTLVETFIGFIVVKNTSLYLTNIGVVGNTGKPYGANILKARFSDIIHAEVKKCKSEYGWLVIDTKWGTKYTFILGNPNAFLHYLNMERQKNT